MTGTRSYHWRSSNETDIGFAAALVQRCGLVANQRRSGIFLSNLRTISNPVSASLRFSFRAPTRNENAVGGPIFLSFLRFAISVYQRTASPDLVLVSPNGQVVLSKRVLVARLLTMCD